MARINLLPWRESLRAQHRREFGAMMLIGIFLALVGMGYWHWHNLGLIDFQKKRNQYLESEISKVENEIREIESLERTRRQLVARMKVVADLQSSRPLVVHLFDELVTTLPDGVFLTEVVQSNNGVSVKGGAQSNARVSAYMRAIEASPWLTSPNLRSIEQDKGARGNDFSLGMTQVVAKKGQAE
jgi:type IV pilus assembly protein PilN